MENSITDSFRMPDPKTSNVNTPPALMPEVKLEPDTDSSVEVARCSEDSEDSEAVKAPKFVDVKNRYIHDFNPDTTSVYKSSWSREWLGAVESKYRLRRSEAAKNVGLLEKLHQLRVEVIKVIKNFIPIYLKWSL